MEKYYILLIIASLGLILLVVAFRFRKYFGLLLIRMMYGRYSYEYMATFKKLFIRSPFQYCFRDEFIAHMLFILDIKDDVPVYKTTGEISFENLPFFTDYREFMKMKGEPRCFHAFSFHNPEFIVKVVGYQELVGAQKATAVYYFIDDLFFMGEYIFKKENGNAKEHCIGRYVDLSKVGEDNFYILNTQDRILHYQDTGFTVEIKYLSREDKQILSILKAYHDHMTLKKLNVED
jgi:hypothetical protein